MATILVVDDDPFVGEMLTNALGEAGHLAWRAQTLADARLLLRSQRFDLVVSDVHLDGGHTGLELLAEREASPGRPQFVYVTGEAELETAIQALRAGAFDYLPKPVDLDRLFLAVGKALRAREGTGLPPPTPDRGARLIGRTQAMVEVFNGIGRACLVDSPVLLVGETGVGKEHVAREIHAHSPRSKGPFAMADAAVLPEGVIPDALLATANGGTLYLEHVGALSGPSQARLARLIEKRTGSAHDLRFIASTDRPVEAMHRDLYYVLSAVEIRIPPLRERREDIPRLVEHVLSRISPRVRRQLVVDAEALDVLSAYDWPGNLRELANVLERVAVRTPGGRLSASEIRDALPGPSESSVPKTEHVAAPASTPRFQDGRYVLTRLLRLTSMSDTWEGVQPALGRKVLIKFLASRGEDALARFQREARIQATLRHPNIPAIYEAGVDPGIPGRTFIAMEFIDGVTLDQYVAAIPHGDPDRVRRVCDLVRQVAAALGYLHGKGIVHRDVKPENVMVTADARAMLLDYGIARSFSRIQELTGENVLVGSVPYMSPEQFQGRPDAVDWRTDIWALGVTLYALLVGRVPFDGDSLAEISVKVREEDPIPMTTLDPTIPVAIQRAVFRALSKLPAERFQSAAEMADALVL